MIKDFADALRGAIARGASWDEAEKQAEVQIRQQYGGERVYVASLPKQRRAVQIAKLETLNNRDVALATGLTIRRVRQLRK